MHYIPAIVAPYSWAVDLLDTKKSARATVEADPGRVIGALDFISQSVAHQDGRKFTLLEAHRAYGLVTLELHTTRGDTLCLAYDGTTVGVS